MTAPLADHPRIVAALETFCRHVEARSMTAARLADAAKVQLVAAIAEAIEQARCPVGPTPQGTWPIGNGVIDAGVRAYDKNYGPHGIRETLMAVWNEMHRARSRP